MINLSRLFPDYKGAADPAITGLTADSRAVRPGYLFAALPGAKADGRHYLEDAVKNGAAAVLTSVAVSGSPVPSIQFDEPRRGLALAASRFYPRQPATIVAVTGTSGKTSTASFAQQLMGAAGHRAVSLGTLGIHGAGFAESGSLTTPDAIKLHADLDRLAGSDVTHAAMEASSHGLDQHRLDCVRLRAAGFTNLTHEHLDYHATMDAYRAAKLRLFAELLPQDGVAVLNADSPAFEAFRAAAGSRTIVDYGHAGKALKLAGAMPQDGGMRVKLEAYGRPHDILLPLIGGFMAMNALCALGLAAANGNDPAPLVEALANLRNAPGRLQRVTDQIYVDYAHKPDALESVLRTLRPCCRGRLIVVFGCGGDRDAAKRPVMGRIARELADAVIVTDDNPRSEDAGAIRAAILKGAGVDAIEIGDRREAIRKGVAMLQSGDVLLVAGKGHEQGQIVGDQILPFNDVDEVNESLREDAR